MRWPHAFLDSRAISFFALVANDGSTFPHCAVAWTAFSMLPFASSASAKTLHARPLSGLMAVARLLSSSAPSAIGGKQSRRASARIVKACESARDDEYSSLAERLSITGVTRDSFSAGLEATQ